MYMNIYIYIYIYKNGWMAHGIYIYTIRIHPNIMHMNVIYMGHIWYITGVYISPGNSRYKSINPDDFP